MKLFNTNKKFLKNIFTRDDIISEYPDMKDHIIIRDQSTTYDDLLNHTVGKVIRTETLNLICVGGIIDGCLNVNRIEDVTDELILEHNKTILQKDLNILCKEKTEEITNTFNDQTIRYEAKKVIAGSIHKSTLSIEAKIHGVTIDELAHNIITKHNDNEIKVAKKYTILDSFRIYVTKCIKDNDLNEATRMIEIVTTDNSVLDTVEKIEELLKLKDKDGTN